jgi:predicted transglutaminase-like cysteine proteinase
VELAMKKLYVRTLLLFASFSIASLSAYAQPHSEKHRDILSSSSQWPSIGLGQAVGVPMGYFELCSKHKEVCDLREGTVPRDGAGAVRISDYVLSQIQRINLTVNKGMRYAADRPGRDRWSVGGRKGDCEDFALTKKLRLTEAGYPSSALLIATARTLDGRDHAVLIVRSDHGDLVLDSLADVVRPWADAPYKWRSIQSPTDVWTWYQLGGEGV